MNSVGNRQYHKKRAVFTLYRTQTLTDAHVKEILQWVKESIVNPIKKNRKDLAKRYTATYYTWEKPE